MTAAQILASLILPFVAIQAWDEVDDALTEIADHDIGGSQVAILADGLLCALNGNRSALQVDERIALWSAGLIADETGPVELPSPAEAARMLAAVRS